MCHENLLPKGAPRHRLIAGSVMADTRHSELCQGDSEGDTLVMETDSEQLLVAGVEVARGRTPTILDPFSIARLTESQPQLVKPLLQRVRTGEFTRIVLLHKLGETRATEDYRWQDANLGWPLVRAVEEHYTLVAEGEGYFVYATKGSSCDQP